MVSWDFVPPGLVDVLLKYERLLHAFNTEVNPRKTVSCWQAGNTKYSVKRPCRWNWCKFRVHDGERSAAHSSSLNRTRASAVTTPRPAGPARRVALLIRLSLPQLTASCSIAANVLHFAGGLRFAGCYGTGEIQPSAALQFGP